MKAKIECLNREYLKGNITGEQYRELSRKLLQPVNWMHRIQFENMLFTSFGK